MGGAPQVEADGEVIRLGPGLNVLVRVSSGDEILCRISKRNHPFRVDAGQKVRIRFRPVRRDKSPLVIAWITDNVPPQYIQKT
jgi:translation initiation factor IF-1